MYVYILSVSFNNVFNYVSNNVIYYLTLSQINSARIVNMVMKI